MKVLLQRDLRGKGIPWSRQYISSLVKKKRFPPPFKMGPKTNAWTEPQIDEYIEARVAERDVALPAPEKIASAMQPSEWQQQFQQNLDKMQSPADVLAFMQKAIEEIADARSGRARRHRAEPTP